MRGSETTHQSAAGKLVQARRAGRLQRRPPVKLRQGDVAGPVKDHDKVFHTIPTGYRKGHADPRGEPYETADRKQRGVAGQNVTSRYANTASANSCLGPCCLKNNQLFAVGGCMRAD